MFLPLGAEKKLLKELQKVCVEPSSNSTRYFASLISQKARLQFLFYIHISFNTIFIALHQVYRNFYRSIFEKSQCEGKLLTNNSRQITPMMNPKKSHRRNHPLLIQASVLIDSYRYFQYYNCFMCHKVTSKLSNSFNTRRTSLTV